MKLSEFEAQTALWQKIEAHLKERREILREKNESDLDITKTNMIRGQIRQISEILGWATPTPTIIGD